MATRNRSTLFIQYRNSFGRPKRNTELLRDTEKVGLIGGNGKKDFVIDVPQLPPKWVDILEQFETTLNSIKEKSNETNLFDSFCSRKCLQKTRSAWISRQR